MLPTIHDQESPFAPLSTVHQNIQRKTVSQCRRSVDGSCDSYVSDFLTRAARAVRCGVLLAPGSRILETNTTPPREYFRGGLGWPVLRSPVRTPVQLALGKLEHAVAQPAV